MLPAVLKRFFWDVDPDSVDLQRHAFFVIERLLVHGDDGAVAWLRREFGDATIADVVRRSRDLDGKTARLWQRILNIPEAEVRCLATRFPLAPGGF